MFVFPRHGKVSLADYSASIGEHDSSLRGNGQTILSR